MGSYLISCVAIYVSLCYMMHKPFIEKKSEDQREMRHEHQKQGLNRTVTKLVSLVSRVGLFTLLNKY